ncbi:uncharacterized protein LOC120306604 isoform X1 [Crotalus tigris]|uniref:uncharacterized protein LOC120306604 isoform X1 n=1 Tax=Crotalus tigris TaxID=88082 RepID=UPI00192F4C63|nr:uncharacterized protein LOC120306604 isoform X1 [Crotalus tigris]
MRNGDMFCLAVRIPCCLLTLLWLREAAGATFFYQYKTENVTQICNKSLGENNATWWFGQHKSSLQIFEQRCCNQNKSQKCKRENCHNKLHLGDFSSGGIFACRSLMGHPIPENQTPIFTSKNNCTNFNFFIIAIINSTAEQSSENIRGKSEENVSIEQKENFTLSCEFELTTDTTTFAVYWFKETEPSSCLFSASNEDLHNLVSFSYDVNCCIDEAFRGRRINSSKTSGAQGEKQTHTVTISNSTGADSASYICVVAAYNRKYTWTIERRTSVSVREASPRSSKLKLKISLAAIAAVTLLMGGIILFLCCKKKAKGKPLEGQQRDQTTDATEDCSPYAVSSRSDLAGPETVYSLATSPGEAPSVASSFPQSTSGRQQEENVQALYSKVWKDKSGPSLASESSIGRA